MERTMTENMRIWLKELYLKEAKDHRIAAGNSHLVALGCDDSELAAQFEQYADEHRAFAEMLEKPPVIPTLHLGKFIKITDESEIIRKYEESVSKLIIVSGYDVEKLIELFAAGYTLQPPNYKDIDVL
jgi:hypothetical protein